MTKRFDVLVPILIAVCASLIILYWVVYAQTKKTTTEKQTAFVLLTQNPAREWLEFLRTFQTHYDVYVVVDNNDINCADLFTAYPFVVFVQIGQDQCSDAGFWNSSYLIKPEPLAWDKALYYFSVINKKKHSHVWLCEDDVFINSVEALKSIDTATAQADFVSAPLILIHEYSHGSHFPQLGQTLPLPWASAMVCICRCSSKVLQKVALYAKKHKRLNFIEVLLPSLTVSNGYTAASPPELVNILYKHEWCIENILPTHFYHPVKKIKDHTVFRNSLRSSKK
jgi:hypothetical protein